MGIGSEPNKHVQASESRSLRSQSSQSPPSANGMKQLGARYERMPLPNSAFGEGIAPASIYQLTILIACLLYVVIEVLPGLVRSGS